MADYQKPLPTPTSDSRPYWEAAKRHELMMQKCQDCRSVYFPPAVSCAYCSSMNVEWVKLSGKGKVYTWNVFHRAFHPSFANDLPYACVVVELEEGPRIISSLVDCKPEEIQFDMPVAVVFEDVTEEVALPKFKRAS